MGPRLFAILGLLASCLPACGHGGAAVTAGTCTLNPTYVTKVSNVQPVVTTATGNTVPSSTAPTGTILPSQSNSNSSPTILPSEGSTGSPTILPSNSALSLVDPTVIVTPASYDRLTYQAVFSSDCLEVVSDLSGGFYYRIQAAAQKGVGYMESVDFGSNRHENYTSAGAGQYSFANGATSIERQYQLATASTQGVTQWILPWPVSPPNATVTFMLPAGSDPIAYPTSVTLTLKASDQAP